MYVLNFRKMNILKTLRVSIALVLVAFMSSCGDKATTAALPAIGATVAKDEMPIDGDTLNHFTFKVTVTADSLIEKGVYDVAAAYGNDEAEGKFTMPKGGETFAVGMRRAPQPHTYIIGFYMPNDTTFNEYYSVSGTGGRLIMQYTKSYKFE
jgi:hypothetical protein